MARQLYDEAGRPIALPTNAEDAKRYRYPHYAGSEDCEVCTSRGYSGMITRKRYTANGRCVHCATLDAIELQSLATYQANLDRAPGGGAEYLLAAQQTGEGRPVSDEYVARMEEALDIVKGPFPTTRQGAMEAGVGHYVREVPCRLKGHLGVTTLAGECYFCKRERETLSPRQEAIRAGAKWYLPSGPCPKCGQRAEKRVDNGQCRGCTPITDSDRGQDAAIMENCPDLVISRADARAQGLKVYRTGETCTHGHRAYRYVSTGGCIECLRA